MDPSLPAEALLTARLRLQPFGGATARALLAGRRAEAARDLDAEPGPGWPEGDFLHVLHSLAEPQNAAIEAKWTRALVHRENSRVVGDLAFLPPDAAGVVELGYSLLPGWRRQGLMTEALRAALPWALRQAEVRVVMAECDTGNLASAATLRRQGLRLLGEQMPGRLRWSLGRSALSSMGGGRLGHGAGDESARLAAGR